MAQQDHTILDALASAGEAGVHVDALVKAVGCTKKELQSSLYELQNTGAVQRLPGNKWKGTPASATAQSYSSTNAPDNSFPKIVLPGEPKFTSYKNSLQQYCAILKMELPKYTEEKAEGGFTATVEFGTSIVKASVAKARIKVAYQLAAFEALIGLGYLANGSVFQSSSEVGQKRKAEAVPESKPAKQASPVPQQLAFKSALNQLAQKKPLPCTNL